MVEISTKRLSLVRPLRIFSLEYLPLLSICLLMSVASFKSYYKYLNICKIPPILCQYYLNIQQSFYGVNTSFPYTYTSRRGAREFFFKALTGGWRGASMSRSGRGRDVSTESADAAGLIVTVSSSDAAGLIVTVSSVAVLMWGKRRG